VARGSTRVAPDLTCSRPVDGMVELDGYYGEVMAMSMFRPRAQDKVR
jgi:hypothetical protein